MPIQIRRKEPRAGRRDPYYSPERDIGLIGPDLVRAAMVALDEMYLEPWFRDFMGKYNVTEQMLGEGAVRLARAMNLIMKTRNPVAALQAENFHTLPPPVQMALYCKMGQVLLAATYSGVKDLTAEDDQPPQSIKGLLEDAEDVMRFFANPPWRITT